MALVVRLVALCSLEERLEFVLLLLLLHHLLQGLALRQLALVLLGSEQ